jgi:23S rRNA (cytidine2498-2'-O)-methyltransferase
VALTSPTEGWVSILPPPEAWRHRGLVSPFPTGKVPIAEDKSAPSRAFAKLVEAELRLGQRIEAGQTVVDLGASPGSWSYVALQRGAKVTAVDRSPLRDDLMADTRLCFVEGDAFTFKPPSRVNWLICDVIAAPERSAELLSNWLNASWMDHFIVTLKFKGTGDYALLDSVTEELMPLCREWRLTRLCANKNEVTAFGTAIT